MADRAEPTVPHQHIPESEYDPEEGDVTVVGCLKGGSTKTTTANYLAFVRALARRRRNPRPVWVLDADTISQTTYDWAKEAKEKAKAAGDKGVPYPLQVERYPFEDLGDRLAELRAQGLDVFADIGGGNAALFGEALKQADRLIVPVSPSEFDTRRLLPTFAAAQSAALSHARNGFDAYVLLAKCDTRTNSARDARIRLTGEEVTNPLPVLQTEVSLLVDYERSLGKVPKNLDEYATVWDEMMDAEARQRAAVQTGAAN
ncbi:ParA family protein [Streptacidiphilus sp. MAP5-52]|uniref:ParA family protein n=1 Tax=Streptacidiphilus sp. MAP5-52 TaxID=3156267 RepID=UPI00351858A0